MKLLGLLIGFWLLGGFFGAGVANCLWAARDGDGLGRAIVNTGIIFGGTLIFLVIVWVMHRPAKKVESTQS